MLCPALSDYLAGRIDSRSKPGKLTLPGDTRNRRQPGGVEVVMTQPNYDVTMENTAELVGPLPMVAPPVLADWTVADPDGGWW